MQADTGGVRPRALIRHPFRAKAALSTVKAMDPAAALREAVSSCIKTRDHPSIEVRDRALAEVALLLEDTVRDGLDDRELAASLDGLVARNVISDGASTLDITGVFWTLGMGQGGSLVLPMEAHLSLRPDAVSVVRLADRRGLIESPESERQFQRVLAKAAWRHSLELRFG